MANLVNFTLGKLTTARDACKQNLMVVLSSNISICFADIHKEKRKKKEPFQLLIYSST